MTARRMVIKVGTSSLTDEAGRCREEVFRALAGVLCGLPERGMEGILVSSGAIAAGRNRLGLGPGGSLALRQAAAAAGQCCLMEHYSRAFAVHGRTAAQILLTAEDTQDPARRAHLTAAFGELLRLGAVPVVNANDSVSCAEIETPDRAFGDNDRLSAVTAELCGAELLVILTDVDGLYTADPRTDPAARRIPEVREVTPALLNGALGAGSARGTGGMRTKLSAAAWAAAHGIETVILSASAPEAIFGLLQGERHGTRFLPQKR